MAFYLIFMFTERIISNLRSACKALTGSRVLLCVSGGPDSAAMAYAFRAISKGLGIKLFMAHLNHQLRGRESQKDEVYVDDLAKRLDIPVIISRRDVKAFAKEHKISLEDAARRLRYGFFFDVAGELGIDIICTAHTRDDQVETVIMRFLRGSGLRGLKGISPARKMKGLLLLRPLLNISRKEVEEYLKSKRVKARLDASNLSPVFFRNKIRLRLLPLIEKGYSPKIRDLVNNLSDMLDKDYDYIDMQQTYAFKRFANIRADKRVVFALRAIKHQHKSILRGIVRKAIEHVAGSLDGYDYRHLKEIESLIYERPKGAIVHLPGGICATKSASTLTIHETIRAVKERPVPREQMVKIPGITRFGKKKIRASICRNTSAGMDAHHIGDLKRWAGASKMHECLDMARIRLPLTVRARMEGDRMAPLGMKGYKKIKDIFIDEKIPFKMRYKIPVIAAADAEILWLCGIKVSDKAKLGPYTDKILKLELLPY